MNTERREDKRRNYYISAFYFAPRLFFSKLPSKEILWGIYCYVRAIYHVNCGKSCNNTREKNSDDFSRAFDIINKQLTRYRENRLLEGEFARRPILAVYLKRLLLWRVKSKELIIL